MKRVFEPAVVVGIPFIAAVHTCCVMSEHTIEGMLFYAWSFCMRVFEPAVVFDISVSLPPPPP